MGLQRYLLVAGLAGAAGAAAGFFGTTQIADTEARFAKRFDQIERRFDDLSGLASLRTDMTTVKRGLSILQSQAQAPTPVVEVEDRAGKAAETLLNEAKALGAKLAEVETAMKDLEKSVGIQSASIQSRLDKMGRRIDGLSDRITASAKSALPAVTVAVGPEDRPLRPLPVPGE